jgi:hypothetical protein
LQSGEVCTDPTKNAFSGGLIIERWPENALTGPSNRRKMPNPPQKKGKLARIINCGAFWKKAQSLLSFGAPAQVRKGLESPFS